MPEGLKRLAKGVAKSAVSVMSTILGPFRKLKDAVVAGVPVLEGATRDGKKIFLKRGDKFRQNLTKNETKNIKKLRGERTVWPSREENPRPPTVPLKEADKKHYSLKKLLEARSLGRNNTIKIGDFDMKEEIKTILDGKVSERILEDGTREYIINNGRKYGAHSPKSGQGSWPIYPKEGPGLLKISEDVVKAIKQIQAVSKKPEREEAALRGFSSDVIAQARRLIQEYLK